MADRITERALAVFRECYPATDSAAEWDESALRERTCFVMGFCVALTSSPWRPIEECGALEDGWYDVWVVKPEYDGGAGQLMHARRFPSGEFVVAGLIYEAQHITHVHRMGPIRGPGEG